jgi:carbamoyl-phosphate synthase large subunit
MASTPLKVLVSSAGRRVELIQCFRNSAREMGVPLEVVACDVDPDLSSACQLADKAFKVPPCSRPDFVEVVADIARREAVQLVVPTIDPELLPFALAAAEFARNGTRVHVSDESVIQVARDKYETMRVFGAAGVPVPHTADLEHVRSQPDDLPWPRFLKPTGGSASRLISVVEGPADLPLAQSEPMIVQEFLDGPEYTINMFIDVGGALKCVVAHKRLRIRAGEVEKGLTVRDQTLTEIAHAIAAALPGARGALCFQVIDDKRSGPKVIEINARFGGGYPLVHHAGATFTRWLLEEISGRPSTAHDNWREGALMLRYDASVFRG